MLKVLDLFSGIGGISLGLESTEGFKTVTFCEIDKACKAVLKKHWPNVPICSDIKNLIGTKDVDVICGGFPCQDISFAGSRKGILKGERSSLWVEFRRLIDETRPKYAIIENVEHLRKNGLGIVLRDLARIGYDAEWACITADSVGYPHQRKRLFIISYPSSQRFHGSTGKERHIQINEEWSDTSLSQERRECKSEFIEIRPILSKGAFEMLRNTDTSRRTAISEICRVTDGISAGLDENIRKARIKQLGNSVVPEIARIIGEAILQREASYES